MRRSNADPRRCAGACAGSFVEHLRGVRDDAALRQALDEISRELGFHYFAMIHHVDLRQAAPEIINIQNYPSRWADHFINKRVFLEDPVLQASLRTSIGFAWDKLPDLIRLTARQRHILEQARREGIGEGFTIPANVPGESHGSVSFATRRGRSLPRRSLALAQLIGAYAFEAARRIRRGTALATDPPRLTERQRECLTLVAKGKTDGEIATILGIGEETVTKHINAARERYDVARRARLVVAALFDGQISFMEARH